MLASLTQLTLNPESKRGWRWNLLADSNIQQLVQLRCTRPDALMLNEACNKAQKASVPSAAVMRLIKEHTQDVIMAHTHTHTLSVFIVASPALGLKWLFFFFYCWFLRLLISYILILKQKLFHFESTINKIWYFNVAGVAAYSQTSNCWMLSVWKL